MRLKKVWLWATWLAASILLGVFMAQKMFAPEADKTVFLPGDTSHGHHQIEMACGACHTEGFADAEVIQDACVNCHGDALKQAKDDHPKSKFTDPRNADRLAVLDARYCATCHIEHRPDITSDMGVTVPEDVCFLCHQDIAEDRPSHKDMAFDTCTNAGCHNFHDNRALYEDFLVKHMDAPDFIEGRMLQSNLRSIAEQLPEYPLQDFPLKPLSVRDIDAANDSVYSSEVEQDWLASSHAAAGVNCSACHTKVVEPDAESGTEKVQVLWVDKPDHTQCQSCHAGEVGGFLQGKHGMRLDIDKLHQSLPSMLVGDARLAMKAAAHDKGLSCNSCHSAHTFDSQSASTTACLGCHNDEHSLAYESSAHSELWRKEVAGELPEGSGVSCATCHMPRSDVDYFWGTFTHNQVNHNQSETLRPNEKMIRPVCQQCHGLGFSIDALADDALIKNNFSGRPSVHVDSIDLARDRLERKAK